MIEMLLEFCFGDKENLKKTIKNGFIKAWKRNPWLLIALILTTLFLVCFVIVYCCYLKHITTTLVEQEVPELCEYDCYDSVSSHGGIEYINYEFRYSNDISSLSITPYPYVQLDLVDGTSIYYAVRTSISQDDLKGANKYIICIEDFQHRLPAIPSNAISQKPSILFKICEQYGRVNNTRFYSFESNNFVEISPENATQIIQLASKNVMSY